MQNMEKNTIELVQKFHRFRVSALPLPLPEGELLTLSVIHSLNQNAGIENTLISAIADIEHVSVPTISRCLGKLEGKGLILKKNASNDKRSICVTLTPQGEAIYQEAFLTLSEFIGKALAHIDEQELEQFFLTFDKIYEAISQEYALLPKQPPR